MHSKAAGQTHAHRVHGEHSKGFITVIVWQDPISSAYCRRVFRAMDRIAETVSKEHVLWSSLLSQLSTIAAMFNIFQRLDL